MKKFYKLLFICLLILSGGMALKAQTYNDSDSEYANRAEVPTYISKIAVAYGAKESTPKDILTSNGFTVIDYDLNKGCGITTHYIYMGYKTTQNPSEAITGIFFRTGGNPPASATFDGVTAYLLGGSGESNPGENTYVDLNEDAGGSYIYTYVTRDASRAAVLKELYFNSSNSASGYVTPNVNLNSGTSGGAIYLHYQQFSGKASATFHYLNANGSRTSSSTSVSVKHHQQAVNNTPSAPTSVTYDGRTWTLLGWREDNTATTAGSTPSYTYMDSKVYRAVYSANVSLTYNANGGSGAPSTQNATQYINAGSSSIAKSNVSITIPATIPTHDATKCNFAGWNTSSSATTAQYQPGNNISINTNTILYAVWPEHNGTKTYVNIGENHVYTWSCCGKSVTEDHIYDNGIDCDLCDGYPATLVDGYYQINNANELLWFAAYVNYIDKTASAKLMNDIEMNAVQWTPIGTDAAYNGTFDGQGYTINNLWHNTGVADGGREGLFTLIGSNGVVKNIVLNNATIWGGSSYGFNSCGGIAIKNQGTISNCIIAGSTIQFGNYAHFGGIAGHNTGTIKNCAVRNSILRRRWGGVNNRNIGGITQTNNGTVTDCYSYDNIYEYGLTTCAISAEGNAPINSYQYTTSTVADAAETAKTKAQFASGEVAYLLQGEQTTQVWGQNIDNEETAQQYPVFSNAKVYKHTFNGVTLYSNHETYGKCGDNLYWYVDGNNALTIYGTGAMYDYNNSNNNKAPWRNLETLPTSLVLEEGITHIGNYAFYYCSGFTGSLTIPNSVTSIGEYAFCICPGLTGSLTIPNSVTSIGDKAFSGCSGFNGSLTIPNSVTTIGQNAFYYCSGFTGSLTIPNSVTTIGESAFENCSGFNGELTIPNSVTAIGKFAFYNCKGLTGSLTIPNSVTTIGNYAFENCSGFNGSLTIGNSVTTIGESAFDGCKGLTGSLTIPNSVTTIGESAFYNCKDFTGSLTIGNSVTTIGNYAFYNCSGFTEVYSFAETAPTLGTNAFLKFKEINPNTTLYYPVSGEQSYNDKGWFNYFSKRKAFNGKCGDNLYWYVDENNTLTIYGTGAMYDYNNSNNNKAPWRNLETLPTSLVLEEGITHIGNYAFYYCSGFTGDLTIPNSVTSIGKYAFTGCSGFKGSLTIGNSVTTIGEYAFSGCSGFNGSLTIPNSVTTIGQNAFYNCKGLTGSLTIPNSVTTIGESAFSNCKGFTGSLTIPNSVTAIGKEAFYNCSGFTEVYSFAEIAPALGIDAFKNINGNATLYYPTSGEQSYNAKGWFDYFLNRKAFNGKCGDNLYWYVDENNTLTIFGTGAMYDYDNTDNKAPWRSLNSKPTSLVLEEGITHIGNYAFRACSGFAGPLTIPNSVTAIGDYAFYNCKGFKGSLTIGNSVTTIGNDAFYGCSGFTGDLTIPNSVTTIGEYAFYGCSGFTGSLTIPNSVTTIGNYAFRVCESFNGSLTIGNSVTTIGESAFAYCSSFTGSLTIPDSVTSIGNYAFYQCIGFNGDLTIGNSVTNIGNSAFEYCSGLTGSLTIPNSVTTIGNRAFYKCKGFNGDLTIGNSVTNIGNSAFDDCEGFNGALTIPNSVKSIGYYAFNGCEGFTEVYSLAETAPTLGTEAFPMFKDINPNTTLYYPTSGEQSYNNKGWFDYFSNLIGFGKCGDNLYWYVDENNALTIYGTGAMYDYNNTDNKAPWRSLDPAPTSLVLKEGITRIGDYAFYYCSGFNGSLTIPNSVTSIGNFAFSGCSGFKGSLTIGNSVTSIGNDAFYYCSGFTGELTIPNSVTTIGNFAFTGCYGFKGSLTIGNSVTTIGEYAFSGCSGFTSSLTIPNSVTTIGNHAFYNCYGFTGDLTIGNSVTAIGNYAFYYCDGFSDVCSLAETAPTLGTEAFPMFKDINPNTTLYYPTSEEQSYNDKGWFNYFSNRIGFGKCGDNLYWYVDENNTLTIFGTGEMYDYNDNNYKAPWRSLNSKPTSLVLEDGITHIGNYAFYNCSGFTGSLTIPNSVTTIGNSAFYNCSGFDGSLTIGNSVTTIGNYAFGNCSGFKGSLTIPNSVTNIGISAFQYCSGFTGSLTIPNSVTAIGEGAFSGCSSFTGSLTIGNSVTTIGNYAFQECSGFTGSLTIPNSVTTIGNGVFYLCSGFTGSLTIPNSVTSIGNYAFYFCSGFDGSLTIGNSVTNIGDEAFVYCVGLTGSLTIPNSVTTIGDWAFYYCSGLTNIFFYRDTNPTIGTSVFSDINANAEVCVPVIWESFDNIPEDKLVKMATYTSQQDNETTSQQVWVFPEGMTEVSADDHVAINASLVLGSLQDYKTTRLQGSEANSLWVKSFGYCGDGTTVNGSITIEDGGQLYCEAARGEVTVKKDIIGYAETTRLQDNETTSETVWYTIASPLKDTLLISDPQFLSSNSDLYRYDEPSYTWQNAKNSANNGFNTIDPGRGYLYANAEDTTLEFTGMINTDEVTYSLTTDGDILTGFHLIGNPFTHNITFAHLNATEGAELVNGYYVLNGEGAWGATLGSNEDDVIKVGQGVLVKAKTEGTLAIAKSQRRRDAESQSRGQQDNRTTRQQVLEMSVANAQHSDRAFVVFDKGVGLDKINHENENIPLLYIPMNDTDYAIAMMDINVNEIPVNFETNVMGEYTISLRQENCEFDELYLLDKQTGEKVNILEKDYTFIATSSENPERFVLLKDNGQQTTDNSHFAYINNGDIVVFDIEGKADISIFDAMGRCLYKGNSSDETARIANDFSAGVYVIQKADDNGVNVQKIIL